MKAGMAAAAEEITAITAVSAARNFNPGVVAVVVKEETTVVVAAIIKTVVVNLIITASALIELYNQLVS